LFQERRIQNNPTIFSWSDPLPLPPFASSEGAGAFMPLKPFLKEPGFNPGPLSGSRKCPGLKANPSADLVRGMNAPAPSTIKSPPSDSGFEIHDSGN
jgi:hypothetical protein